MHSLYRAWEAQANDVIGFAFRGKISNSFDLDDNMGASTCVSCGECVHTLPMR